MNIIDRTILELERAELLEAVADRMREENDYPFTKKGSAIVREVLETIGDQQLTYALVLLYLSPVSGLISFDSSEDIFQKFDEKLAKILLEDIKNIKEM